MERKTQPKSNGEILWKKIGGGSLSIQGRIIKPGQTFRARPDEISKGFMDTVIPMEPIPEGAKAPDPLKEVIPGEAAKYTLKTRGKGWYDIVDASGKVLNEKALKKEMAEQLLKDLEA